MPELPEIETICRGLGPHLEGRKILAVKVFDRRLRRPIEARLADRLRGRTIVKVGRKAKYLLMYLHGKAVWVFHLGMSGKLIHVEPNTPKQKHDHIIVELDSGYQLRYHDPRRFGLSLLVDEEQLSSLSQFRHLGLDPFDSQFNGPYLYYFMRRSDRRVRDLLLDQEVVAGIGNIYANEILSRVGVRPTTRCRRLPRFKIEQIAAMIPKVLGEAICWCGTSFSDYRDADDRYGEFQNHLRVYDREGNKCRVCSNQIKRVALGNRSAFYCPSCQK